MVNRLTVTFSDDIGSALAKMSTADCRPPRDQIRYLVINEAIRRGIVVSDVFSSKNANGAGVRQDMTSTAIAA